MPSGLRSHAIQIIAAGWALFAIIGASPIPKASPAQIAAPTAAASGTPAEPARAPKSGRKHAPVASATPLALPADIVVPAYRAGDIPFHDGERLDYQASWLGIPAATARIELHRNRKDASLWNVEAWIETNKLVDVFFKMRDYMVEHVAVGSLQAQSMYIRQSENRQFNEYRVTFDREKNLVTASKKNRKGTTVREFISSDPYGPLSGAIMALSQPLDPGSSLTFDVFTGNTRYVFNFHVDKTARVAVPAGNFDALRITPGVLYLSNGKLRGQAHQVMAWVSADKHHIPLRIQAAAFIGSVRADLIAIDGAAVSQR